MDPHAHPISDIFSQAFAAAIGDLITGGGEQGPGGIRVIRLTPGLLPRAGPRTTEDRVDDHYRNMFSGYPFPGNNAFADDTPETLERAYTVPLGQRLAFAGRSADDVRALYRQSDDLKRLHAHLCDAGEGSNRALRVLGGLDPPPGPLEDRDAFAAHTFVALTDARAVIKRRVDALNEHIEGQRKRFEKWMCIETESACARIEELMPVPQTVEPRVCKECCVCASDETGTLVYVCAHNHVLCRSCLVHMVAAAMSRYERASESLACPFRCGSYILMGQATGDLAELDFKPYVSHPSLKRKRTPDPEGEDPRNPKARPPPGDVDDDGA